MCRKKCFVILERRCLGRQVIGQPGISEASWAGIMAGSEQERVNKSRTDETCKLSSWARTGGSA